MRAALFAGAALGLFGWSAQAQAKTGDAAWAQCVWRTDAAGAQAWLSMPAPDWRSGPEQAGWLLGHRLAALCGAAALDERKPGREPNWKGVAAALRSARSKAATAAGEPAVNVELCRHLADQGGLLNMFRLDIVRVEGSTRTVVHQQYYDMHQGQAVKLPQGLRVMTSPEAKVTVSCQSITSDGTLINA